MQPLSLRRKMMGLEGLIVAARAAHPKLMGDAKEPVTSLFGPTVKGVRVVLERVVDVGMLRCYARSTSCFSSQERV